MGLFNLFKKKKKVAAADEGDKDPWIGHVEVTRKKMEEMIKVRVRFIGQDVSPQVLDLSSAIEKLITNDLQRVDVRHMWKKEAEELLGSRTKMSSTKKGGSLLD